MIFSGSSIVCLSLAALAGCGSTLPDDVLGYESRCVRLNEAPIAAYDDDPHEGMKNVYACNVDQERLRTNERPFPGGTIVVKEATRDGESFPWLVAVARKDGDSWQWDEYTRNFADEDLRHNLAGEDICTGCHVSARDADWIFTRYDRPDARPGGE